ncbi:MAG: metal-dependent hydrolase [Chloroflexota bacterium]|nr:metal-dependent hydrolase [Chloroflexota bacterium]
MIQVALHLATIALLCFLVGDVPPLVFAASLLLALLPDIDTPKSLIGSLLRPISRLLERKIGHRTVTHSLLALGLIAGTAYLIAPAWWLVLTAAYASHLLLDLLIGVQGIMLFWPSGEWMTLTAWRDNGPAPKILLSLLLPSMIIAAT